MFWIYIVVFVSLSSYWWIGKWIIGSLNGSLCKTLRLWFPLMGRAFFENFWTNEYDSISGYLGRKRTPLYIFSM